MHFSTATLIALLAAAPSTLAASLLQPRQGYTVMGSPGELLLKGFSNKPGASTCNKWKAPSGATVRLPKEYMEGDKNCGRQVHLTFQKKDGHASNVAFVQMLATVYGTCVDCQSFEAAADGNTMKAVMPSASADEQLKGYWGPIITFAGAQVKP